MSDVAAAEAALRHNIRTLLAPAPEQLRRELEAIGGSAALPLLAHRGPAEGLAIEGLRSDQARALERSANECGATALVAGDATRALLLGPVAALAAISARLCEWGQQTEALGGEISAVLTAQQVRMPVVCGDHVLDIGSRTLLMGVVNVTPDSFSGDGVGDDVEWAVALAEHLVDEGADIIDIGGESTRPHSTEVPIAEELHRVMPVVERLAGRIAVPLSIDTRKAAVARRAVEAGCGIVNDVWGLRRDPEMAEVLAAHPDTALVAMHNQQGTAYGDLGADVARGLRESLLIAARHGIGAERVIVDPGFGFAKTPAQNLELMRRLGELRGIGRPLLLGVSRKSTIGLLLGGAPPEERTDGGNALAVLGVAAGAEIIRTHDVGPTRRALQAADAVLRGAPDGVLAAPAPGPTQ